MSATDVPVAYPATSAPLLASAHLHEAICKPVNDAFIKCRYANDDPSACAELALSVFRCADDLYRRLGDSVCAEGYRRFWRCLDVNNQDHIYCRDEESDFVRCTKEHFGVGKRLWRGSRPEEGLKPEDERPETSSWRYQQHVFTNKVNP